MEAHFLLRWRYKGFISWDDNIYVIMPCNDYNKLLS
ncbi:MAG: LicD family protein [Spirochaetaceae bacterium]|nr:LicD family protein [Spirochaetaceae bacterium]